jgi:hypothetical protein
VAARQEIRSERAAARRYLGRLARLRQAEGQDARVKVVVGAPKTAIAQVARDQEIDLIAMATHGRGGLSRLVLGSVATATLQQACLPVLLVRPAALRQQSAPAPEAAVDADALPPRALVLPLSPEEVGLVRQGLVGLVWPGEQDPALSAPAQALLARLGREAARSRAAATAETPEREPSGESTGGTA